MKTPRTSPTKNKHGIAIGERDLDIIELISVNGYVSRGQIGRALVPDPDTCRRRLRQLFNAGYLSASLQHSRDQNLWSATARGLALLEERRGELPLDARAAGPIRSEGVPHHLLMVDARIAFKAWSDQGVLNLAAWHSSRNATASSLLRGSGLVCDGLVELEESRIHFIVLEFDRQTESRNGVLLRKLQAYVSVLRRQPQLELWLIGTSPEATLEALARRAGLSVRVRCLHIGELTARPLAPPPATIGGEPWQGCPYNAAHAPKLSPTFSTVASSNVSTDRVADRAPDTASRYGTGTRCRNTERF